ncbi:hypothetical protein OPV22_009604 [Ensete ventricosum]|uniref:MATH domain-containing protein n=1 Tax=Ensete ventricosum TaxID=4639 RepID=A0AAV8RJG6_ENSVE|nr:hypothetical protein OPV22_009604 [Ensete ventricosum]
MSAATDRAVRDVSGGDSTRDAHMTSSRHIFTGKGWKVVVAPPLPSPISALLPRDSDFGFGSLSLSSLSIEVIGFALKLEFRGSA